MGFLKAIGRLLVVLTIVIPFLAAEEFLVDFGDVFTEFYAKSMLLLIMMTCTAFVDPLCCCLCLYDKQGIV